MTYLQLFVLFILSFLHFMLNYNLVKDKNHKCLYLVQSNKQVTKNLRTMKKKYLQPVTMNSSVHWTIGKASLSFGLCPSEFLLSISSPNIWRIVAWLTLWRLHMSYWIRFSVFKILLHLPFECDYMATILN